MSVNSCCTLFLSAVDEIWTGIINPNLTPQPPGSLTFQHLQWIDGTPVNDNGRSKHKYEAATHCHKFDNHDSVLGSVPDDMAWNLVRREECNTKLQVICQYDCNNVNKRDYNHLGCYEDWATKSNFYYVVSSPDFTPDFKPRE